FLLQLLLPSKNAGLVGFRFGFRDHALLLIQDGKAGVGENVIGIALGDFLGHRDGLVKASHVLIDAPQAVHGVSEGAIQFKGFLKWTAEMENYARPKPKNP